MITQNASLLHISDEQAQCISKLIELFHERESALRLMVHMILHDDSPMCKRRVALINQIQTQVYAQITRKQYDVMKQLKGIKPIEVVRRKKISEINQPSKTSDTNLNDPLKVDTTIVEPEMVPQEVKSNKLPKNQQTMSRF